MLLLLLLKTHPATPLPVSVPLVGGTQLRLLLQWLLLLLLKTSLRHAGIPMLLLLLLAVSAPS
jgi:hypothetical protein